MIRRFIPSRTVEALKAFIADDADFGALTNSGKSIYLVPYDEMGGSVAMSPNPRQLHIYEGALSKVPGTTDAWNQDFDIRIEYHSPRNEAPREPGTPSVADEVMQLANLIYVGQSGSKGRFRDPDNSSVWLTTGITRIQITMPQIAEGEASVRRVMDITFTTRENAAGERV